MFTQLFTTIHLQWHLPSLKVCLKEKLMSALAKALKVCMYYPDPMISFNNIHVLNNRATPTEMMKYNLSIQVYKLYTTREHSLECFFFHTIFQTIFIYPPLVAGR